MDDLIIREAHLDDLPGLLKFEQGVIHAERPYDDQIRPGSIQYYDLAALIQGQDSVVMVADYQGELIASGYADIRVQKPYYLGDRYAYLGFMYVLPAYRGNNIINHILDALKLWSADRSISQLWLEVYEENKSAIRAYQKAGFQKRLVEMRLTI